MLAPSEQPSGSSTTAEAAPTQSATTTTTQQLGDQLEAVTSDQSAGNIQSELDKVEEVVTEPHVVSKDEGHKEDEIQESAAPKNEAVVVVAALVEEVEEEEEEEQEEEESKCESDCESSTSVDEKIEKEVEQVDRCEGVVGKKQEDVDDDIEILGESETESEEKVEDDRDESQVVDDDEEEAEHVDHGCKDQVEQLIDLLSNTSTQCQEITDKVNGEGGGIVRATFVDFVMEEEGQDDEDEQEDSENDEEEDKEEDEEREEMGSEQDGMMMLTGNPDLQKIRAEQVRKWLIFEQDSANSVGSSLSESMEVDSLAVAVTASGTITETPALNGDELLNLSNGMDQGEGQDQDNPRRVRFLTDQEGNLLISVFMTNTPTVTTPLSEEPSLLSNGGGGEEPGNMLDGMSTSMQHQNPSLVVSPPSLDNTMGGNQADDDDEEEEDEELVDSIEPSAPPLEETAPASSTSDGEEEAEDDDDEPASIVLVVHPEKEPPREKPPAPPTGQQQEDNDSSDETLSVSSCNSMIEIMPSNNGGEGKTENNSGPLDENNNNSSDKYYEMGNKIDLTMVRNSGSTVPMATPCFQLGISTAEEMPGASASSIASSSPQPASLIIHEMEEHNEGMADQNGSTNIPQIRKVPTVDENNNVVEDSVLEEGDLDDEEPMGAESDMPQFNPEIGEQVKMPDLRRSTSSSDGEVDDEGQGHIPKQPQMDFMQQHQQQKQQYQQQYRQHQLLGVPGLGNDDDQEQQMVSLCIQEEHISAVAVTIAKWESMSKAQSTENLSCPPLSGPYPPNNNLGGSHAPVTKCSSSPCPKSSSPQQLQRLLSSPGGAQGNGGTKPIQPVAPLYQHKDVVSSSSSVAPLAPPKPQSSQVNRVVIHGTNSNPINNDAKMVAKAAGWQCWGNKLKDVVNNGSSISADGGGNPTNWGDQGGNNEEIIYAQPNPQAGSTMTSITNPSAILKAYPKPLSKGEIMNWLREGEIHRAGLMLNYAQSHHHAPVIPSHQATASNISPVLVSWFFGLISRQQAEKYLQGQPPGTFLVRISTRIWGYTLSYQASSGRTKHFLISAVNPAVPATLETGPVHASLPPQTGKQQRMSPFVPQGRYAFIGTNMTPYGTLVSLIRHHSHAPITKLGGEKLLNPCPGGPQVAGMEQLFQKSSSSAQPVTSPSSSSTTTSSNFIIPSCS